MNSGGDFMFVIRFRTVLCYLALAAFLFCTVQFCTNYRHEMPVHAESEPREEIALPILMYHAITEEPKKIGKFVISKEMLEEDLCYLREQGYQTVTVNQVIDYVKHDGSLPEKPIMLTFDDGYYNNYCYAYPLLKKYNMQAVISLIGKYTDLYTDTPDENPAYSHITWDEVREMMNSGLVEFQNHSYDLHSNSGSRNGAKRKNGESKAEYTELLKRDLERLQEEMRLHTGSVPTAFTYPFGGISNDSRQVIKDMGFQASFSCEEKINLIRRNDPECLYQMKRFLRSHRKSAEEILNKVLKEKESLS